MIKIYLHLFNTTCCLSFEQLFSLVCDHFKGEFEVSFSNLKGTELGRRVAALQKERKAVKYKGFSFTAYNLYHEIKAQLPPAFMEQIDSYMMIPSDVTQMIMLERKRGNYVTRNEAYRELIDQIESAILSEIKEYEIKSRAYLDAIKWRDIEVQFLMNEIERRKIESEMIKQQKIIEEREKAEIKKREEWLKLREQRILEEMNELDEEIKLMEKEKFEQDQVYHEIKEFVFQIEHVYLRYLVAEQVQEYERSEPFWFCTMVNKNDIFYARYELRTCDIDFKIVNPYHIYIIHQILMEGAKAYRHSFVKEKEIQVLLYILGLDPSPDIEIKVVSQDLERSRACKFKDVKDMDMEEEEELFF